MYRQLWRVLALEELLAVRAAELASRLRDGDTEAVMERDQLLDRALPPADVPRTVDVIFPFESRADGGSP